jgi:hypothetical protein
MIRSGDFGTARHDHHALDRYRARASGARWRRHAALPYVNIGQEMKDLLHGAVKLAFVLIPGEGRAAGGEYADAISSRTRRARRVLASGREGGGIAPK